MEQNLPTTPSDYFVSQKIYLDAVNNQQKTALHLPSGALPNPTDKDVSTPLLKWVSCDKYEQILPVSEPLGAATLLWY